ncbi:MAG TPA: hypothetical protein VEK76_00115 [Candidatus Binatia bacterium]|nr:hypothetical protein [Candidatus Binatia bacterium]
MLVTDFVQLACPFSSLRDELLAARIGWLADAAAAAYREGEQLSLRLPLWTGPVKMSKRVVVDLGSAYVREDRIVHHLTWRASGTPKLFPVMEADIEFAPMGDVVTSVKLMGRYEPPLGRVGRQVDRMLLHRVAEASVRALLTGIADRLTQPGGEPTRSAAALALAEGW